VNKYTVYAYSMCKRGRSMNEVIGGKGTSDI
jgi:hypothetical protein